MIFISSFYKKTFSTRAIGFKTRIDIIFFSVSDDRNLAMTGVFIGYGIMIMFNSAMLIFATLKVIHAMNII